MVPPQELLAKHGFTTRVMRIAGFLHGLQNHGERKRSYFSIRRQVKMSEESSEELARTQLLHEAAKFFKGSSLGGYFLDRARGCKVSATPYSSGAAEGKSRGSSIIGDVKKCLWCLCELDPAMRSISIKSKKTKRRLKIEKRKLRERLSRKKIKNELIADMRRKTHRKSSQLGLRRSRLRIGYQCKRCAYVMPMFVDSNGKSENVIDHKTKFRSSNSTPLPNALVNVSCGSDLHQKAGSRKRALLNNSFRSSTPAASTPGVDKKLSLDKSVVSPVLSRSARMRARMQARQSPLAGLQSTKKKTPEPKPSLLDFLM